MFTEPNRTVSGTSTSATSTDPVETTTEGGRSVTEPQVNQPQAAVQNDDPAVSNAQIGESKIAKQSLRFLKILRIIHELVGRRRESKRIASFCAKFHS